MSTWVTYHTSYAKTATTDKSEKLVLMKINPERFWEPWEAEADSFDRISQIIYDLFEKWSEKGHTFAWRGLSDARWALHSSLYRRLNWTRNAVGSAQERNLYDKEGETLARLHRWGLHKAEYGRLSVMGQLAVLQHYGSPTRLIDITFNPWIGIWFAVEQSWNNGEKEDDVDARLFAVDVTDRLINEQDDKREWEDDFKRPWPSPLSVDDPEEEKDRYREWTSNTFAWKPPHFHPRLAAQNGGFLFGGVPTTSGSKKWPKSPSGGEYWRIDEVRWSTSVALRVHKLEAKRGGPSNNAVYTIRIKAEAIPEIRNKLQSLFGYEHSTIYSDYSGFSRFGTPRLQSTPSEEDDSA